METGGLVVEHNVICAGNAHDIVASGDPEQRQQIVHVILICFRVICVTDIATHGQTKKLSAKMILESGTDDLLPSIQILGTDESNDRIHEQRLKLTSHGVGASFERLLIHAMMGVGRKA